jgi:hypothetical protein
LQKSRFFLHPHLSLVSVTFLRLRFTSIRTQVWLRACNQSFRDGGHGTCCKTRDAFSGPCRDHQVRPRGGGGGSWTLQGMAVNFDDTLSAALGWQLGATARNVLPMSLSLSMKVLKRSVFDVLNSWAASMGKFSCFAAVAKARKNCLYSAGWVAVFPWKDATCF